jgi:hypothetical protein
MITYTKLHKMGRLGNQLFELSCCIAAALNNNDQYIFPKWDYEKYFNLHNCFSNHIIPSATCDEFDFNYQKINSNTKNIILDIEGYRQSYLYLTEHEDFIRQKLTPIHQIEPMLDTTSLHIRRGDYLNLGQYHTNLTMGYYQEAMKLCPSERYMIFSDDIAWCKKNFVGEQFVFAENNHETMDLKLMSQCANNIIANSSFSWWGAYLSQNPNKKVIYPSKWFGEKLPHNTKDLCPIEWMSI